MTELTETQREMLTEEEQGWFPCGYPANELLCRLAKERESVKDAFLELMEQQSDRIRHKNEMLDEAGAAINRNADSIEEAVRQRDEVQEKLKAVEDRLRKSDKLLHRYSKDGIHFCLEECGACQVLTLFGGSVGRR